MTPVLVTGATGTVGAHLVAELLAKDVPVRAFVRDRAKATRLLGPDVDIAAGDFTDPASLRAAVQDVRRVFLTSADGPQKVAHETAVIDAAAAAGVELIVKLSTVGAEVGSPLPGFDWHGRIEHHLQDSRVAAVVLRANFFMTNLLASADSVRATGTLPAPAGDGAVAKIDPRDVAAAAAAVLADPHAVPATYELTGPAAVTYGEVAKVLSQATGRPIHHVDLPEHAATDGFTDAGLPDWLVTHLTGAFRLIRQGALAATTDTVVTLTSRPPRSLAVFAAGHAAAFTPAEPTSMDGATEPQDIARLFIEGVNAGNIDALERLYEPDAVLHFPPGNLARGREAIRQVITQLLAGKPTMTGESTSVIRLGDLALTSGRWSMTSTGPDGAPFTTGGHTVEVARRQPDGHWLMIIDEPVLVPTTAAG